jgi:chaperonin GroES
MATTIKPLHDRVIVRRIDETSNQTAGGLLFPIRQRKNRRKAKLSPPAPENIKKTATRQTLDVKEGDRVLFGKYSGSEIKIDGEELLIMREDEILELSNAPERTQANFQDLRFFQSLLLKS